MDLLTLLFRLPFLPLRGLVALGGVVRDEAERQAHDPAAVRRALEEAERARREGDISDQDVAELEKEAIERVVRPAEPADTTTAPRR